MGIVQTNEQKIDQYFLDILREVEEENENERYTAVDYHALRHTFMELLRKAYGLERTSEFFRQAGYLAGAEHAKYKLDLDVDFNTFIANLRETLDRLKIGDLRMEAYDPNTGSFEMIVRHEHGDGGMSSKYDKLNAYDEGLLCGIFDVYSGKKYDVKEVDCWTNENAMCRFVGTVIE